MHFRDGVSMDVPIGRPVEDYLASTVTKDHQTVIMVAMQVAIIASPALGAVQNVQSEEWVREWVLAVCQEDGPEEAEKYAAKVVGLGVRSKRRLA